jgi:DNA-directed RNA polymerase specialized sigma24 family protein
MVKATNVWETSRVGDTANRALIDARMMEVHIWCMGDEAAATARRILGRKRLTLSAEDLVSEAKVRVLRTLHNNPGNFDTFNPAAYCTRAMGNYVKSLLSRRTRGEDIATDDLDMWVAEPSEPGLSDVDHSDIDRYCAAVEALGSHPIHVSGALTVTYLKAFADIAVDDAPWPQAGVPDGRRNAWPALWYATRNNALFPSVDRRGRDGQARTRQRHLEKIDGLLVEAVLALTLQGRA